MRDCELFKIFPFSCEILRCTVFTTHCKCNGRRPSLRSARTYRYAAN